MLSFFCSALLGVLCGEEPHRLEDTIMKLVASWTVVAVLALLVPRAQAGGDAKGDVKPTKITGELKRDDPLDAKLKHPSKVHELKMAQGQAVVIRLKSSDFNAFLVVRDSNNKELSFNDDDPDDSRTFNSKLIFAASKEDTYRIVATSIDDHWCGPCWSFPGRVEPPSR